MEWFDLWCASLISRPARLAMTTRVCTANEFLRQLVDDTQLPAAWSSLDVTAVEQRVGAARRAFEQGVAELEKRAPIHVLPTRLDARYQLGTDSPWLVVWGDPGQLQASLAAVVGTRRLATLPSHAMSVLQAVIGRDDTTLVSGGALGVDTIAHQCALGLGRPCVLVLAGGLLCAGPRANVPDFRRVLRAGGAMVTARPVQWQPGRWEFSERNRLIASLSGHVILARAPTRSGARITCDWARTMGRPVLLLPWTSTDLCIEGCIEEQQLGSRVLSADLWSALKEGAPGLEPRGSQTASDRQMLLSLTTDPDSRPPCKIAPERMTSAPIIVPAGCQEVWELLRDGSLSTDDVIGAASERPSAVLAALSTLELFGLARLDVAGRWQCGSE
jgi:DNA protecting protein DprA